MEIRTFTRTWMPLACALAVLLLRAAVLPWWEKPKPAVLDEFSYLLLADTFTQGRLTNPVHPMWQHFETLFVLQQPSYASVYPPAQGLALAAGQMTTGDPWWGVWLSVGLMIVAVGWMLQAWLPPFWAALGTAWIAVQLGLLSYWMNSYWGGAMAAAGGALVLGATPRLRRQTKITPALALGTGLVFLANSRPYEGLVLGGTACLWMLGSGGIRRLAWPAVPIVLAGSVFTAFYCRQVTGHWLTLPAQEYMRQYAASPVFIWQNWPPEPAYRHAVLRDAHVRLRVDREQFDQIGSGLRFTLWKLLKLGVFYLGPLILIPPLMLYWVWMTRIRPLIVVASATLIAVLITVPLQPHYAAPLAGVFYAVAVQSLRMLWLAGRRGHPFGKMLTKAAPLVAVLVLVWAFVTEPPQTLLRERAVLQDTLIRSGEKHLVIVSYGSMHNLAEEWVHNRANIDDSAVVWARDMGHERNAELIRYYAGRKIWMLEADAKPARIREFYSP